MQSLAANAVMAGCKAEYFPVVLAGLRGVLNDDYNLHGTLVATTHPCAPMMLVSGPLRHELSQSTAAAIVLGRAGAPMPPSAEHCRC